MLFLSLFRVISELHLDADAVSALRARPFGALPRAEKRRCFGSVLLRVALGRRFHLR